MIQHATCAFIIDTWQADPYDDRDGIALSRTRVTKTFTGELAGTSTAELLMAMAPHESASYVGFERIDGSLHGRQAASSCIIRRRRRAGSRPRAGRLCRTPGRAN